jgi:hypothetical protein
VASTPDPERLYTVEEANAVLDEIRERLVRLRDARRIIVDSGERIREHATHNGGGVDGAAHWESLRVMREELEWFAGQGIILRDTESGLLDFPAEREGRIVQLCWRLGEDRVAHWHEVDAGFPNRKPL